ncbi:fatty acid-binding protein-like isoform X2 [Prorops nasuta]
MAPIVGKYQHERNENLNEYFRALGVPYVARLMMGMSHPTLEISNENDKWTIRNITALRTMESTFTLGEEYKETMPSGVVFTSVTTIDGNNLITISTTEDNKKITRKFEFTDENVVLTMTDEKSGQVAKRFYKRIE